MKFVFRLPVKDGWYGKYVLTSMGWWFIPCYTIKSKTGINRVIEKLNEKEWICGSCGGSWGILGKSTVTYGSLN